MCLEPCKICMCLAQKKKSQFLTLFSKYVLKQDMVLNTYLQILNETLSAIDSSDAPVN